MDFQKEPNWIFAKNEKGEIIAEVTFPKYKENLVVINHTYVNDSLRGQGVAGQLMEECHAMLVKDGRKAKATCPYAVKWFENHPEKREILAD